MDTVKFIEYFNSIRKTHVRQWYVVRGTINGIPIELKAYGTWIQRIQFNHKIDGGISDISVKECNAWLESFINGSM